MKIKALKISNFVGVDELSWNPSEGINILEGVKGSGKTSVLEAIEAAFSNNRRRTEVVRHGEEEATLYVECDNGLEIDRRIRNEKSDYMKLRQEGKAINSTEKELRKLISGDIFRPLDFVNMDIKNQTEIILNMIQVNWTMEDIKAWFGEEVLGINYDKHILQILKDIEVKAFAERTEINRQIHVLEIQCNAIEKELPPNYVGDEWKDKNIQEYYAEITKAQEVNSWIDKAKELQKGFDEKVSAINSDTENQKSKVTLKYREMESDIKDIVDLSKNKIDKAKAELDKASLDLENNLSGSAIQYDKELSDIEKQFEVKKREAKDKFQARNEECHSNAAKNKEEQKDLIQLQNQKVSVKESELLGLDEKKELEFASLEKDSTQKIDAATDKISKAKKYLESNEEVDIKPLQIEADNVEKMKGYLREWDRLQSIINGQLAEKKLSSTLLTKQINIARQKPADLLKTHKLPINGIGVDEKGMIRIHGTLLDGLSDGEKLEVAFNISLQRMGELKIMCLDGFERLNQSEQKKVLDICEVNDIQAFVTIVKEKEFSIEGVSEDVRE
ncbi:AAA family ATPase [Clostridium sp. FP1]|uniref:AAA family ATPase n=1 Tax=Clostridium sp. FP1 TaxID=2724076 RepID=UPI0013E97673|nr:AAA family ATPase [Clostridium sp. FP1]MBZ9633160.1 AAA family ATPase [Clostridium sp. FP1]